MVHRFRGKYINIPEQLWLDIQKAQDNQKAILGLDVESDEQMLLALIRFGLRDVEKMIDSQRVVQLPSLIQAP